MSTKFRVADGFSLTEALISLSITLVVVGFFLHSAHMVESINEIDVRDDSAAAMARWAFDEIVREIGKAGYGLEGAIEVLPYLAEEPVPASDAITLRSNPEGVVGVLLGELVSSDVETRVASAELFKVGDWVLLTDLGGNTESAEVVLATRETLAFRSLDSTDGELLETYSPYRRARVLKLREVRFRLEHRPDEAGNVVIKEVSGGEPHVLARGVRGLKFDYLDARGESVAPAALDLGERIALVRVHLGLPPPESESSTSALTTAVALGRHSVVLGLESRLAVPRLRLTHIVHPIAKPAGLVSRGRTGERVILSHDQDAASFQVFRTKSQGGGSTKGRVVLLPGVREPIAACFGPENSSLGGSLFVAADGPPPGQLVRVLPEDSSGELSPRSPQLTLSNTEILGPIGGIAFGPDGALYISRREYGAIFRYGFDASGEPMGRPEEVAALPGSPGSMILGSDLTIYFLMDEYGSGSLWKLPFDDALSAGQPVRVGPLPGEGMSLAWDPKGNSLYALVRDSRADAVIVEISPLWSGQPAQMPMEVFRLSQWRRELEKEPLSRSLSLPGELMPERLDFLSFDSSGSLYLGITEMDLVLRVHVNRSGAPVGDFALEAASVLESPFAGQQ